MKKVINLTIDDGDELRVNVVRNNEMTLKQFWGVLDEYGVNVGESPLSTETMVEFKVLFDLLVAEARDILTPYWLAHWQIGDDSFSDAVDWIISQGRDYYYRALVQPETIELPKPHIPEGLIRYSLNEALEIE